MSKQKFIIEITPPDFQQVHEIFHMEGYSCPVCRGKGNFTERLARCEYKIISCDYCGGSGKVKAEIKVQWKPDPKVEK